MANFDDLDEWIWVEGWEYRIKPEPKSDIVAYAYISLTPSTYPQGFNSWGFCNLGPLQITSKQTLIDNIRLVFDGETRQLKSVEIVK